MRTLMLGICAVAFLLSVARCGSSTDSTITQAIGSFAVSSPTAVRTSTTAVVRRNSWIQQAAFPLFESLGILHWFFPENKAHAADDKLKDFKAEKKKIDDILAKGSVVDCVKDIFVFPTTINNPTCYGPNLTYQSHPDGADGSNCGGASYPCFPSGDLGIWTATESGEACASAKLNQTLGSVASYANGSLKMLAAAICVAKVSGMSKPAAGSDLDLTSAMNSAGISGATFTKVALAQLTARTGAVETYELVITGTIGTGIVDLDLIHSPTNASNTEFKGHLKARMGGAGSVTALSLTYQQTGTSLLALMRSGSSLGTSDSPFNSGNEVDYASSLLVGKQINFSQITLDTASGLGTVYASWQANPNDDKARIFNATVANTSGTDAGFAYFGFGDPLKTSTNPGIIKTMICNWAGPGNNHTGQVGKAQGQAFSRDATTGVMTATTNNITYAPTNSCDCTGAGSPACNSNFKIGANSTAAPASVGAVSNTLTTYTALVGGLGTIPTQTEPTY